MNITELKPGDQANITGYHSGNSPFKQRLIALGLLPQTPIRLLHIAPLGDPIAIEVRGFTLSLRRQEASILKLE